MDLGQGAVGVGQPQLQQRPACPGAARRLSHMGAEGNGPLPGTDQGGLVRQSHAQAAERVVVEVLAVGDDRTEVEARVRPDAVEVTNA